MLLVLFIVTFMMCLIVGYPWLVAAKAADSAQEADHRRTLRAGALPPLRLVDPHATEPEQNRATHAMTPTEPPAEEHRSTGT